MTSFLKHLAFILFQQYLRGQVVGGVRRRGLLMYFRAVNGARRVLVTLATLAVCIQLMTLGLVGSLVTASWIWIKDENVRLYVLLSGFGLVFALPLLIGCYLLSERFWLTASGAETLIEERPTT